jgi:hypothetical protein
MKWKDPHISKVYEALGCLADSRLEESNGEVKVYSSSRKKFYNVKYDKSKNEIMSNDNISFYVGALGYPSIAYLMKLGELPFNDGFANALKDIPWKDLNVKNKNDFSKTVVEVDKIVEEKGVDIKQFHKFIEETLDAVKKKGLTFSLPKPRPPKAY